MSFDDFFIENLICDESFQQYCLGSNIKSLIYWEEWLKSNPNKLKEFSEAKRIFYIISAKQGNQLDQLEQLRSGITQFEAFKEDFQSSHDEKIISTNSKKIISFYKYIGLVAASLLIFAALSIYLKIPSQLYQPKQLNEFSSINIKRKTIILKDGSIITLAKNSNLKLSPKFDEKLREVWLVGEAYFNVMHNKEKPFIVHVAENNIRVLGTIFNIKAYPDSAYIETSLLEGLVSVTNNLDKNFSIILKPNHKLISINHLVSLENSKSLVSKTKVEGMIGKNKIGDETQWVRNKMEIENQSLTEIAKRLEDWYGIKIDIEDKEVGEYRYSGVFENENLIKTLEALQLSYYFNFKADQNQIIITK